MWQGVLISLYCSFQVCCSSFGINHNSEPQQQEDEEEYRLQAGEKAAKSIEALNNQKGVTVDFERPFVCSGLTSADVPATSSSELWYGSVHGVPMLFAALGSEIEATTPRLMQWLLRKEAGWAQLPINEGWPAEEARQVTSKYRWYNVLAEMETDAAMVDVQALLKSFIIEHFLILQGRFADVLELSLDNITRSYWQGKYARLGVGLPATTDFSLDPSLYIECWLNSHRPEKGMDSLSIHEHGYPWHGYILLNAHPSNTSYYSPTSKSFFSLQNSNNVLVMLPGGLDHAVLPSILANRLSIAFDITYGINFHGRVVTHPSVVYPPPVLDDKTANTWMKLMDEEKMTGLDLHTFNYKAVRQECEDCPGLSGKNWGGLVDLRSLLDSVGEKSKREL